MQHKKMSQNEESEDENSILPIIITSLTDDRGKTKFCQNLITPLFERGVTPYTAEFPEVKIKKQIVDQSQRNIKPNTTVRNLYHRNTDHKLISWYVSTSNRRRRYRIFKVIHKEQIHYLLMKYFE